MDTANTLLKRGDSANRYSLYVFAIIIGCIASVLIGGSVWAMYKGKDDQGVKDISHEQQKYMREVRQHNLNTLAWTARRPDMIVPVEKSNV